MAPTSHGVATAAADGVDDGPPPSTLAAQLVDSMSASVRSSKPDETAELKRFFGAIERVKNQPSLLRTQQERVDHNHMLIYVYARVQLEGIRWEDPLLDRATLKADASRAITFFRVTIKETPEVLCATASLGMFLFRGPEPLWLWIFPKLLKMLGYTHCVDLTASIEALFQDVYLAACRDAKLWAFMADFLTYMRLNFTAICTQLVDLSPPSSNRDVAFKLRLPPDSFLETLETPLRIAQQQCTYTLTLASQALQHTSGLLSIMTAPFGLGRPDPAIINQIPWLLDAHLQLLNSQARLSYMLPSCITLLLQSSRRLLAALEPPNEIEPCLVQKCYMNIALLAFEMLENPPAALLEFPTGIDSTALQSSLVSIAGASLRFQPVLRIVVSQLIPSLHKLLLYRIPEAQVGELSACLGLLRQVVANRSAQSNQILVRLDQFTNPELAQQVRSLSILPDDKPSPEEPMIKRRKVSDDSQTLAGLLEQICSLLGVEAQSDLDGFDAILESRIPELEDSDISQVANLLGFICCAVDGTLISEKTKGEAWPTLDCLYCRAFPACHEVSQSQDVSSKQAAMQLFKTLLRLPRLVESRRPRITTMVSIRRLLRHFRHAEVLDIESSPVAQWCLTSLQSSVRELRIASGRTLAVLLTEFDMATSSTVRKNRDNVLGILRSLSDQTAPHLTETCIMAWSQVGIVVSEDHLHLVLVKLVHYLGSISVVASAAAFTEIINLAQSRRMSPRQLFEPFWRYLAFTAVKDCVSRPKLTRALADMMEMSVPDFLLYTQGHALPWLVLTKRQDVIHRIAEVRNEQETSQPIMDNTNLGPILALLLLQDAPDVPQHAMDLLMHISPHFQETTFVQLLQSEPMITALELLKAAGDADEDHKPHARAALSQMATLSVNGASGSKQKTTSATGPFLQTHALGLMARLTDVFNETPDVESLVQERQRCLRAMEEMVRAGKKHIRIARPQISACLLTAIGHEKLRSAAFSCWSAMLLSMKEDVEAMIETTFYLVSQYWTSFDKPSQGVARHLIETLMEREEKLLEGVIGKLPSLSHIHDLSDLEDKLSKLRSPVDSRTAFGLLAERIRHENAGVAQQALTELASYLQGQQGYLQASAVSEQPDSIITVLSRALLDCASKYNGISVEITQLCTQCIGLVGCLDPNRVETVRAERQIVVKHNFEDTGETTDFVFFLLEEVLVKSFISATDTRLQGYLSFVMQELLDKCDIRDAVDKAGGAGTDATWRKWRALSESAREVLAPFLKSKYLLSAMPEQRTEYPIFRPGRQYGNWLRALTLDLLRRPQNGFADVVFYPLCRVIRVKDLSPAEFLLPYVVLHVIIGDLSSDEDRANVLRELTNALQHEPSATATYAEREDRKLYCEAVFRVLDYAMRYLQAKRSQQNQSPRDVEAMNRVQILLDAIPAELISQRAVDCKSYSRALFHLEQHIRQVDEQKSIDDDERDRLLQRLQDIYSQIDEPDGLEGISAHLQVLDINQQVLSHRKAGRWEAAQTWYEIKLAEDPSNAETQINLLTCLKESGQHDVLLNCVEGMEKHAAAGAINRIVPFAVEACWATGRWNTLRKFIGRYQGDRSENFNICVGQALLHLHGARTKEFVQEMQALKERVGSSFTFSTTSSLQACHEPLLNCHVLTDLELIAGTNNDGNQHPQDVIKSLNRRLEVLGSYVNDKQYVLGIRRAAMQLLPSRYGDADISTLWLSSARLARKANALHHSFNAVLHASQLGDGSATIENARLLWKEGHNRKAIQILRGAIASGAFTSESFPVDRGSFEKDAEKQIGILTARAHLLLAKWLDNAGQTHATALRQQYQQVPKYYNIWEKGHYYLGRHYKKLLESERALKPEQQSDECLSGETAKLVIENYVRAMICGNKYLYQTLPRVLTLWLELAAQVEKPPEGKVSLSRELYHRRKQQLDQVHVCLRKYVNKMPAYIFYTALPQIVARIAHPNADAFSYLKIIILRVVEAHPRQSLWNLFAIMTSKQASGERRVRGTQILHKLRAMSKPVDDEKFDLKALLRMGEKLADQLLMACNNGDFQSNRTTVASITRDLNFNHKCTPCPLVVPIEATLTATLPTLTDPVRNHKAFSRDVVTIDCFRDEVLVLGSLAKPRKLIAQGSNGMRYGLLIKPKDDLRTDQRLMEFNGMINRSLKRDAESSRRQLYIKTYAVIPLNEECGIIEWVDGLKTLRDILLSIYRAKGVVPNYGHISALMKDAVTGDKNIKLFTENVLGTFPPVLPQWFISQFPNASAWFSARLRYTRSSAVMSMVGTILGLGDRHGENVLLEEGNGGVFHVDFNCLFDKGLTFAQPERVPFRLTHNMVAAMGIYGVEGPFRQCSELTLSILRQQEETLMTILEAFIYDPTLDLQRDKRRKHEVVRLNPPSVVESIKRKVKGLLPDESIPLSVEGQADELIKQAVDPRNLSAMYIGWCPFL